jgi:hypothetical protein
LPRLAQTRSIAGVAKTVQRPFVGGLRLFESPDGLERRGKVAGGLAAMPASPAAAKTSAVPSTPHGLLAATQLDQHDAGVVRHFGGFAIIVQCLVHRRAAANPSAAAARSPRR